MARLRQQPAPPPPQPTIYSPSVSSEDDAGGDDPEDTSAINVPHDASWLDSPDRLPAPPPFTFNSALKTIPATPYTSAFSCPLLAPLLSAGSLSTDHFSHLACSFFPSRDSGTPAPTLLELKKHVQAICLLLSTLEASDLEGGNGSTLPPAGSGCYDFLDDPYKAYDNDSPNHNQPLKSILNDIPSTHTAWNRTPAPQCPILDLAEDTAHLPPLVAHTNACLEELDHILSPHGGLLALVPPDGDDVRADSQKTIFGKWLSYTQDLVRRGVELEREIALLRELVASNSEMVVPGVSSGDPNAGDEPGERASRVVEEQDRWVLAGLNKRLWDAVQKELDLTETIGFAREERAVQLGVKKRGGNMSGVYGRSGMGREGLRDVVAWIEVTGRIFRVLGQGNRVFLIPAWDIKPGAELMREIERRPQVQYIYTRAQGLEGDSTFQQRRVKREMEALERENRALKEQVGEKDREVQEWLTICEAQQKIIFENDLGNERVERGEGKGKGKVPAKGSGKGKGKADQKGTGKGKEKETDTRPSSGQDGIENEGNGGGDDGEGGKKKPPRKARQKKQTAAEKKAEEDAQAEAAKEAEKEARKLRKATFLAECRRKCKVRFAQMEKEAWLEEYRQKNIDEFAKKEGEVERGRDQNKIKERSIKRAGMVDFNNRGERAWEEYEADRKKDSDGSNKGEEDKDEDEDEDEDENEDEDDDDDKGADEEDNEAGEEGNREADDVNRRGNEDEDEDEDEEDEDEESDDNDDEEEA